MLRRTFLTIAAIALLAAAAGPLCAEPIRVGSATVKVDPPNGTFLAGYDPNRRSTGIHDSIFAKAAFFDDGKTPIALVVVDCIGLHYPVVNEMRKQGAELASKSSLTAEHIIVVSTHSHYGPDVIGLWGPDEQHTGFDRAYVDTLVANAAKAIADAAKSAHPAELFTASTTCDGWAVNDSEPGVVDHSVTILQARDTRDGKSIVTLTNFACHPTVADPASTLISSDWVGAFYASMAAALPGDHLFLQGPIGGWIQPTTPERTFTLAEKYGKDLAEKTLAALKAPAPLAPTGIRFAHKAFTMPLGNPGFVAMSEAGLTPRTMKESGVDTEVAWFSIGPAQFATHPGETAPYYGFETKKMMKSGPKFVLGLGLDELGYIVEKKFFEPQTRLGAAKYLVSMSPGPEAGAAMLKQLREIIPGSE